MNYAERRKFLWIVFLVGLALIVAVAASGTTLVAMQFDELAQRATVIARLKCLSVRSFSERGEIWTETQFEVRHVEKGLLGGVATVRMPGGQAEGVRSKVDGVPGFQPGEEVYLFLWGGSGGTYRVLGWMQGTFRVRRNPRGEERVTQDSGNMAVFDSATRGFRKEGIQEMSVEAFENRLRKSVRGTSE